MVVEWSRRCYRSGWHLFSDDQSVITAGRYYIASSDAQHLSSYHNLGSREWHDKNALIEQGLGEDLSFPSRWDNGARPAVEPVDAIAGDAGCLERGEQFANRIDLNVLQDGFPPDCFDPTKVSRRLFDRASAWGRCAVQRFYARVIDWLYANEQQRIVDAFQSFLALGGVARVHPATRLLPSVASIVTPNFTICVIDGTRNAQQMALQAFYSLRRPENFGSHGTNAFWYAASTYVHGLLAQDGMVAGTPIFIAGHSYGGATALNLAARYRFADPNRLIRWLTFGCPKTGDERMAELVRRCDGMAVSNSADLVTIVPFDPVTIQTVIDILGNVQLGVWFDWIRPPNSVRQDEDGSLHPNDFPPTDLQTVLAIVARVLANLSFNAGNTHSMSVYLQRIIQRCPAVEWPITTETNNQLQSPNDPRLLSFGELIVSGLGMHPIFGAGGVRVNGTGGDGLPFPTGIGGVVVGATGGDGLPADTVGGVVVGGTGGDGLPADTVGGVVVGSP